MCRVSRFNFLKLEDLWLWPIVTVTIKICDRHLCINGLNECLRWKCKPGITQIFRGSVSLKVRPHLHTNTNEAYANICLDCNTMQNVVFCRASEWFSLKYQLQADSIRSASDRAEAVFLSSVTRLHCYACLALACLVRVFVLMWTRLNISSNVRGEAKGYVSGAVSHCPLQRIGS